MFTDYRIEDWDKASLLSEFQLMNELSVIGSLRLRKDYWDHHVVNIASCEKGLFGERLFRRPEKKILREIINELR